MAKLQQSGKNGLSINLPKDFTDFLKWSKGERVILEVNKEADSITIKRLKEQ